MTTIVVINITVGGGTVVMVAAIMTMRTIMLVVLAAIDNRGDNNGSCDSYGENGHQSGGDHGDHRFKIF